MNWQRLTVVAALAAIPVARAVAVDEPGVIPLKIAIGEAAPVGPPPVRNLICDDTSLVTPENVNGAPALRAVRAGTTLCSLTDALSVRRTYRVIVYDAAAGQGGAPQQGGR